MTGSSDSDGLHDPDGSELDEELMALGPPPRRHRNLAILAMALVLALSAGLLATLRGEIAYFFAPSQPRDLGLVIGINPADLEPNTYARVEGMPMASSSVEYSRPLTGGRYSVFPLAGQRHVFVQVAVGDQRQTRSFSRREFTGRLVTFGSMGNRFGAVRRYFEKNVSVPVSSESFLLMADEAPGSYGWALIVALIAVLFIVVDVFLFMRWFRPLPREPAARPAWALPRD